MLARSDQNCVYYVCAMVGFSGRRVARQWYFWGKLKNKIAKKGKIYVPKNEREKIPAKQYSQTKIPKNPAPIYYVIW